MGGDWMKQLIILCGPPGSGKSTLAKEYEINPSLEDQYIRISQDDQGKAGHLQLFNAILNVDGNIIVDRMGFNKQQRKQYLELAKQAGYTTKIIVLHENQATCLERMLKREGHPTIQDEKSARSALHTFFTKYERPEPGEADEIEFRYPEGEKPSVVLCDLDGTLCNIDHRLHFVRGEGKKDWKNFMYNIPGDSVNEWCRTILSLLFNDYAGPHQGSQVVYCSGRGSEYRGQTKEWLNENNLLIYCNDHDGNTHLYMRERGDHRTDYIVKEIILDFEILTRFTPLFAIDDRTQVVQMWRRRGITCLQCAEGDF